MAVNHDICITKKKKDLQLHLSGDCLEHVASFVAIYFVSWGEK